MRRILIINVVLFLVGMIGGYISVVRPWGVSRARVQDILTQCLQYQDQRYVSCLRLKLRPILRLSTAKTILDDIEGLTSKEGPTQTAETLGCHEVAHIVGEELAYMHEGAAHLASYCGTSCAYGCIHGVIYTKAREDPTLISHLDALCEGTKSQPISSIDGSNCVHGVGHFLTEYASYDLKTSLHTCFTLTTSFTEQCISGAIMEMFAQRDQQQPPFAFPSDVGAFCTSLPTRAWGTCVGILSAMVPHESIPEGMDRCAVMSTILQRDCFLGMAEKVFREEEGSAKGIIHTCIQQAPDPALCIQGAAAVSLNMDPTGKTASEICLQAPDSIHAACQSYMKEL